MSVQVLWVVTVCVSTICPIKKFFSIKCRGILNFTNCEYIERNGIMPSFKVNLINFWFLPRFNLWICWTSENIDVYDCLCLALSSWNFLPQKSRTHLFWKSHNFNRLKSNWEVVKQKEHFFQVWIIKGEKTHLPCKQHVI